MSADIERKTKVVTVTIANNGSLSNEIDIRGYAAMQVKTPSSWTAANIGFQGCEESGGTFANILKNTSAMDGGVPVQIAGIATDTAEWHVAPDEVFGAHFIKLLSKSTTEATKTAVNQGGARTLIVVLKS